MINDECSKIFVEILFSALNYNEKINKCFTTLVVYIMFQSGLVETPTLSDSTNKMRGNETVSIEPANASR
jgi:hypothetical protein